MPDLEEVVAAPSRDAQHESPEEANERRHQILMRLLRETRREFDKWPEWKKQYPVSSRQY
jgi:hypothetical protein